MNKHGDSKPLSFSAQKLSDTSSSSPVIVPTPASVVSELEEQTLDGSMEKQKADGSAVDQTQQGNPTPTDEAAADAGKPDLAKTKSKVKGSKKATPSKKKGKRVVVETSSSDSDHSSESESSDDEDGKAKKKKKAKKAAKKAAAKKIKLKAKAKKKSKKYVSSSDESSSSDSESDTESEDDKKARKRKAKAKAKSKTRKHVSSDESSSDSSSSSDSDSESELERTKRRRAKARRRSNKSRKAVSDLSSSSDSALSADETPATTPDSSTTTVAADDDDGLNTTIKALTKQLQEAQLIKQQKQLGISPSLTQKAVVTAKTPAKKNGLEYKRVDQVWDSKLRDYKYTESAGEQKDEFDCVFNVRRKFNWENKHIDTQVDIKSKLLRNALKEIFKDCRDISLVEDTPAIHPHMLFLFYNEFKTYMKKTLKKNLKRAKKSKERKQLTQQIAQCKLLLGYIDEDYDATRKALKPMLKAGTITYDLVWALFKPNTIAFTPTYGNKDDPRAFKVDSTYEYEDWFTGSKKWVVSGRYLDYDGKRFGLGDYGVEISSFKGHKKIMSLAAYPLDYHKDPETIQKHLVERGKKFVALQGMNYRVQRGLAYMKYKRTVQRFNINGRVMVDPAIFRRINPNYPLSYIRSEDMGEGDDSDDSDDCCGCSDEDESSDEEEKQRLVVWKDKKGKKHLISVPASQLPDRNETNETQKLDSIEDSDEKKHIFTEEELLISSPVVLGFAFSEKMWLEFSLSGIEEIQWNSEAFDNLVLPKHIKQNLKGLVSSHRFNAAKTIDDVIQGKGKGLNVVLHGPPGVGKTLTGESIAEYLKCPLYAVSAGELGTNSRSLEIDLNRIMDITHSWGAILLLDEADVFLEARQAHDIHRNSLVSVFLRLTEYYQGILFLTTNRVETFDEAFQSRIHMGIRYENLTSKARKKIWQHHVGKVVKMSDEQDEDECKVKSFKDDDYEELSKKAMNGRQIKNTVKTSQSIALAEKETFSMGHIKRVLEVAQAFEDDMRGGLGYRDAMRQYT